MVMISGAGDARMNPITTDAVPRGSGQGPLRELLDFVSRRSETFAWRMDDGEWRHGVVDREMVGGGTHALRHFGIDASDVVTQTESPVRFEIRGADGSRRTLQLHWASIHEDLLGMPPHVRRWPGLARIGLILGMCVASWGVVIAVLDAVGVF